jgi:hypothetical protein
MWVQRVIELTGWEPLGISVDWAAFEGEPGVRLPADYAYFGPGDQSNRGWR